MQSDGWIALLKRFNPIEQEKLMLVTVVNTEFAIQSLVLIEKEFVVIRGRLSGSSDTGRAFMIPYNQINYIGYQRPLKEEELYVAFREVAPPDWDPSKIVKKVEFDPYAQVKPEAEAEAEPEPAKAEGGPTIADVPADDRKGDVTKPLAVDKAALLERLKARVRRDPPKPPGK